jgi:acetyltransferase-like isoleucine patch superfamily enzyme
VLLGPGSFVYSRAIICPGVRLRFGTVLAPGAVLICSTTPYSFWGGNPARCIKESYTTDAENIPYRYALAP